MLQKAQTPAAAAAKPAAAGGAAPKQAGTQSQVAPPGSIEAIPDLALWAGLAILGTVLIWGVWRYFSKLKELAGEYALLSARVDGHFAGPRSSGLSPGHTYAIASRGPNHAREAELQSAGVRWRHFSMAFPHLEDRGEKRPLVLISRPYIVSEPTVQAVQDLIHARAVSFLARDGRAHIEPSWIKAQGADFDALRHPELAISNPALYTFPFFLTWQRRHQWGVLPYGVHNRIGVICHKDHPSRQLLCDIESRYYADIERARREKTALWVNDPAYAIWLPTLLNAASSARAEGSPPSPIINRGSGAPSIAEQHNIPTVFSIGAYLHKEILPLTCAVLPNAGVGANYAASACELEVTDVFPMLIDPAEKSAAPTEESLSIAADPCPPGTLLSSAQKWERASAVIVDLAVIPKSFLKTMSARERGAPKPTSDETEWLLFKLPHCVYVPIGIGYSVAAVPLLLSDPGWWNRLLADVGDSLTPISEALGELGIELDSRLWNSEPSTGE